MPASLLALFEAVAAVEMAVATVAQATGELVQDFQLVQRANALHLFNAPSRAATASLAIGGEIAGMVLDQSPV